MPNYAYTPICFTGHEENIIKLKDDIEKATEWLHETNYKYYNITHFLSLSHTICQIIVIISFLLDTL